LKLCGINGHTSKAVRPCGFKIGDNALSCHHHSEDKSREKEICAEAVVSRKYKRLPEDFEIGELRTVEEIQRGYTQVVKSALADRHADLRRLDTIIRALNGAATALQTQTVRELNDTLLRAEGHGPALVILEGLKTSRMRRLPGVLHALPTP
jgi:phosphomannomutase